MFICFSTSFCFDDPFVPFLQKHLGVFSERQECLSPQQRFQELRDNFVAGDKLLDVVVSAFPDLMYHPLHPLSAVHSLHSCLHCHPNCQAFNRGSFSGFSIKTKRTILLVLIKRTVLGNFLYSVKRVRCVSPLLDDEVGINFLLIWQNDGLEG